MAQPSAVLGAPLDAPGPHARWDLVREQLAATGTVLVHGRMPGWLPPPGTGPGRLGELLGRDWQRYQAMDRPRMRERLLASRLLLRYTAAAAIGSAPELVDLAYQSAGRPYVRGCDQIDVSLSHTEETMVVGITRRGRIGVDVERADRRLAGTGSERQACTPYELRLLDAAGPEARNDVLVRMWTLKEAYSKALGQGLRFRFTEFGFEPLAVGARLTRPDGTTADHGAWTFGTFGVGEYVVSAAVHDTGFGELTDLSVDTVLDDGLLDALLGEG
ncbi:4'-phosphopantetheinyl transferase family protein [Streptomyces sp. NPDC087440]|uniref:4'-phosphopantetheinyl transferase family protein n=1 Tax=Streptomyces sp. NPDC087440 TaxID=3365790 RepID=UPI003808E8E5